MKLKIIFALITFLVSTLCLSAPNVEELERKLSTTSGLERAQILAELAIKVRQQKPELAIAYAKNSLQLLIDSPHPETELKSHNALAWAELLWEITK